MTAIVTDVKYRMTLSIIRDLANGGVDNIVALHKGASKPVGFYSKHVKHKEILKSETARDLALELVNICKKYAKDELPVLLCTGRETIEAVSEYKELFEGICHLLISDKRTIDSANDKSTVLKIAKSIGVPVPAEYDINNADEIKYPCIIKYRCGEKFGIKSHDRYKIVYNKNELIETYNNYKKLDDNPIIQEYISGDGYGVSVIMNENSEPVDFICHKRLRECPESGGPSSCAVSFYDERMVNETIKLLKAINFKGIAMVEFKGSPENFCLMEINPRVWGSYPLTRIAKSSFTMSWFNASRKKTQAIYSLKPNYRLGVKMQFLPTEAKLLAEVLRKKKASKAFEIIGDILNIKVHDGILELSDFKGSINYILSLFGRE